MTDPYTPYVPRLVLERDLEAPGRRVHALDASMLLVDLKGFTKLSERLARLGKMGAEELLELINTSFSELLAVAYDAGGSLLKFGGDALLLCFAGPEHASRASFSAAGMQATLRRIGGLKTSAGSVRLRMRAGVHSGLFHLFLVGSSHRELLVAGPSATQAVLMEHAAEPGEVLVSAGTASALDQGLLGAEKSGGRLLRRSPPPPAEPADLRVPKRGRPDAFIPAAIRDHLAGGGFEPEHRQVSIAFIAFGGTDELIDREGADSVGERLDALVRSVQEQVDLHELCFLATDVDVDGGKILVCAGAPRAFDNDEERILRALRAVADRDVGIRLRIGVNRGRCFSGHVGPFYRRTYAVMGDAVNTAARIMARAAPGEILAATDVLERSQTLFASEALEPFRVKGKAKPVVAHRVGAAAGPRVAPLSQQLPFVGREAELGFLLSALDAASVGRGGLVEIVGEPGIGKSRLVGEVLDRAKDMRTVVVGCERYETHTAYFPFRALLARVLDIEEPDGDRLRDRVRALAPNLEPLLPLLALPLDVRVEATPEVDRLDPAVRRDRLHETVTQLVAAATARTLFVIDDAQWMDDPSVELLAHLARESSDRGWLWCVTRRPVETGAASRLPAMRTLALEPLGADASAALAAAASGVKVHPARAAMLAERAGGNPLFLQELVAAAATSEDVEALPENVEALIATRIDRLAPRDRVLLRYAAVVGSEFDPAVVAYLSDEPDAQRTGLWGRLGEFVQTGERTLRFRHALFQQVAYEGLPYRRRRPLHERVGRYIEDHTADPDEQAAILSLHFHRAQVFEESWRYSKTAAVRAREKFAHVEASVFYGRALEAARALGLPTRDVLVVWMALGDTLNDSGRFADAAAAYRRARTFAAGDRDSLGLLAYKEGMVWEAQGEYGRALRWYGRGVRVLTEESVPEGEAASTLVALRLAAAGVYYLQGRYQDCVRWCKQVLEEAEAVGDRVRLGEAYDRLHLAYTALRDPARTTYGLLALSIFDEEGRLTLQGGVLNNLGMDAYFEGNWDTSLEYYRSARDAFETAGNVVQAAVVAYNIGEILSDRGRLAEAEEIFHESLRTLRAARSYYALVAVANLGRVAARAGRFGDAERLLEEALIGFRSMGATGYALETEARIAENLVFAGFRTSALRLSAQTLTKAAPTLLPMLYRVRGYAFLQAGRLIEARDCFDRSLELARNDAAEHEAAATLEALGRLARQTGADPDAFERESADIRERLGIVSSPAVPLPES